MDLNSLAHGVDPKTGKYLSPEQRKEAFRKSLGKKPRSGYVNARRGGGSGGMGSGGSGGGDDGGGGSLVKRYNFRVIEKLIEVKKIADELFKVKQERVRLESKFAETQRIAREKAKRKKEESGMESRPSGGKNILSGFASKAAATVGGGLFGILKALATFAILDFISKPENRNMVEGFVKLFIGGGSILERVFGGLQLLLGVFLFKGFTRVLNPLKLIGDIKWALKNASNFKDLFKSLFSKNLAGVGDAIKQIFPKTASIFKKGLQGALQRVFLKVFGKNIFSFLKPFVKTITKTIVRPLAKLVTRVPVVGTLLAIPINMFLGDPIDKAAVKAIGAGLGTFVVGALGSVVPGAGTVLGGIAGGLLGDFLAGWLYDSVIAPLGKTIFGGKKDQPQMNTGGIASGPESGYDVTLHGTEAVIPLDKLKDIVLSPYKTVASIIIGSTMAVLKSMGAVGSIISPIALQMFNPFIRVFGISAETFASGLGKGVDLFMSPASAKESADPSDYLTDKKDPYKPAGGGMGGKRGSGASPYTDPGESPDPGMAENTKGAPYEFVQSKLGANKQQWDIFRNTIAGIESGGKYDIAGGSGGHYDGRYQLGAAAKTDGARAAGLKDPGHSASAREAFRKNADLQEKLFAGYTLANHNYLMGNKKYKDAAIERKLEILGYAHNQGMGGAEKWLNTGQVGADGFGTKGTKYTDALAANFRKANMTPKKGASSGGVVPLMAQGGEVEDPGVLRLFDKKGRDIKNTAPGHSEGGLLELASGGIIQSAKKAVAEGKRGPATPPCASWVRMVLGMAGHPAAEKVTQKGDLDPDGTAYSGRNFAASFAGSDMGAVIRSQSALQPGDVVLHKNTYGNYTPGAITHVSIASDKPGKILHQSTSGGAPKEGGIWNFAAGIRLGGSGTVGASDTESSDKSTSPSAGGDQSTAPPEPTLDAAMLRQLFTILTGKSSGPDTPPPPVPPSSPTPPAPALPSPVPSKSSSLHSMSNKFTLDKKMSAAHSVSMPSIIVNSPVNYSANTFSSDNLNTMTLSETANLKLL
jgi:hypothetical protein